MIARQLTAPAIHMAVLGGLIRSKEDEDNRYMYVAVAAAVLCNVVPAGAG